MILPSLPGASTLICACVPTCICCVKTHHEGCRRYKSLFHPLTVPHGRPLKLLQKCPTVTVASEEGGTFYEFPPGASQPQPSKERHLLFYRAWGWGQMAACHFQPGFWMATQVPREAVTFQRIGMLRVFVKTFKLHKTPDGRDLVGASPPSVAVVVVGQCWGWVAGR